MNYIIYNPNAGLTKHKDRFAKAKADIEEIFSPVECVSAYDTEHSFYEKVKPDDVLILLAGDGTLHILINKIKELGLNNEIYIYCYGTGNDFLRDLDAPKYLKCTKINSHITNLPTVSVNGKKEYFLNSTSLGFDAAVCAKLEENKRNGKSQNYKKIAIKLLMKHKFVDATITVDGNTYEYKKVWLAAVMNGRYYGGGMKCAPDQDRDGDLVTLVVISNASKLKGLLLFSKIFKGKYKNIKYVHSVTGHNIKVTFHRPTYFETDGEVMENTQEFIVSKEGTNDTIF